MTFLQFLIWGIVQLVTVIAAMAVIAWQIAKFAYKRQLETLQEQVRRIDVIEKYYDVQFKSMKTEHEKALQAKDDGKAKALQGVMREYKRFKERIKELEKYQETYDSRIEELQATPFSSGHTEIYGLNMATVSFIEHQYEEIQKRIKALQKKKKKPKKDV